MELTAEQKEALEAKYETWGLNRMQRELERSEREVFVPPEVTAFAQYWVAAKEAGRRRDKLLVGALLIAGVILIGAAVTPLADF